VQDEQVMELRALLEAPAFGPRTVDPDADQLAAAQALESAACQLRRALKTLT
jgi:hypothetical protein